MANPRPLSVIVPVGDSAATLTRALTTILSSDLPRDSYELIVVDDASSDGSAELAARHADTVVRLTGRRSGPAYARNRGADIAHGEILLFVDPDVTVQPDTLPQILGLLSEHPELGAVAALHAPTAAAGNFISQYWNLVLRFGESGRAGTAADVASPCAAIRSSSFFAAGTYDEWRFENATLEGVELGARLTDSGHDVLACRDIEITALQRRTLRSLCREVWNRSVLVTRSLGYRRTRGAVPSEVVFTLSRSAAPVFAALSVVAFSAAYLPQRRVSIEAAIALLGVAALNLPALVFFSKERGVAFAVAIGPLHFLMQAMSSLGLFAGWILRYVVGDRAPDAATQSYAEVGLDTWPPVPRALGD